ncbi:MAG: M23 family metallopeptidase [Micrococcaceae bacterium]
MKAFLSIVLTLLLASFVSASGQKPNWRSPTGKVQLKRPFAPGKFNWNAGHRGVDLGGHRGQNIVSPADGEVFFVGNIAGKKTLSIKHTAHLRSTFEPVISPLKKGDMVKKGQVIGTLLADHEACPECLHWGVKTGERYLNPLLFLNLQHAILLPR